MWLTGRRLRKALDEAHAREGRAESLAAAQRDEVSIDQYIGAIMVV